MKDIRDFISHHFQVISHLRVNLMRPIRKVAGAAERLADRWVVAASAALLLTVPTGLTA